MPWLNRDKYEQLLRLSISGGLTQETVAGLRRDITEVKDELKVAREQLIAERQARDLALHTMVAAKTGVVIDPPHVPRADEVIDPHEETKEMADEMRDEIQKKGLAAVMAEHRL